MAYIATEPIRKSWLSEAWDLIAPRVATWRRRARERAQLARLNDRELKDIGITRAEAQMEANKSFWIV